MAEIQTIWAALIAGLVTSVHCVGMCGPLACSVAINKDKPGLLPLTQALYHLGRLFSYTIIGALCGLLGQQPLKWVFGTEAVILPWILVGLFIITALGLWKRVPRPQVLTRTFARLRLKLFRQSSAKGGLLLGLFTPLLPCGPLYLLFGVSLLSGSPLRGAEFALAFGMGTVPLLWLAQQSLSHIRRHLPAATMRHLQRGLALCAAAVMLWRLHDTIPFPSRVSETEATPTSIEQIELPSCCP